MSTVDAVIPERGRLTFAETLADTRVMAARQLRKILRRPMYVVYLFVQPVIFVLLFRYVFGGAINTGRISYVNYLMPGILVMTAVFGALTTRLRLLSFRSDERHAERGAGLRGRESGDAGRQRRACDDHRARPCRRSRAGDARLAGRATGDLRAAVRARATPGLARAHAAVGSS